MFLDYINIKYQNGMILMAGQLVKAYFIPKD